MEDFITSLIELKELLRLENHSDPVPMSSRPAIMCGVNARLGYLPPARIGVTSSGGASNRSEEHLAGGLFLRGELSLPNGEAWTLLDYQFPLKSVLADAGIGKIDLLGLHKDGTLAVVELKVAGNGRIAGSRSWKD
jgi:hypothetical protein